MSRSPSALYVCAALALSALSLPGTALARAADDFEEAYSPPTVIESPENFQLELKIGPYRPDTGEAYKQLFDNDPAWLVSVELDANLVRIPHFGTVGVGAGWGWGRAKGNTLDEGTGAPSNETAELVLYPLSALAVLRIDALVRDLGFPLMLTGKFGGDFVRWKSSAGGSTEAAGLSPGIRWAAQAALDLNFIERSAARNLDEEWGINRTFLLFEYFGSTAGGKSLPVGDQSFFLGLGFMF